MSANDGVPGNSLFPVVVAAAASSHERERSGHGQYVDVTGVPEGQYQLVHEVNPDRRLRESSYANNASSLVFDLRWPRGRNHAPTVELRGRCADSDRCRPKW